MEYFCRILEPKTKALSNLSFLSAQAKKYLDNADDEIFSDWQAHFQKEQKEKSLANVMSRTVLAKCMEPGFAVESTVSNEYGIKKAFHNRLSGSEMFLRIFRDFNHSGVKDVLILTQSDNFKDRFLYDGTTMTIDSVAEDFLDFAWSLNISDLPRLFFLVFNDIKCETSVWQKGNAKYLRLLV